MVRLKDFLLNEIDRGKQHFNSTMVRLKELEETLKIKMKGISIPLWFD